MSQLSFYPGGGGYSDCGPVRVKKAQSKNFENYAQMVVSFYKTLKWQFMNLKTSSFGSI